MRGILNKLMVMSIAIIGGLFAMMCTTPVYAEQAFALSPMSESIILNPGDTYRGSFRVSNTSDDEDFVYEAIVEPFYVDESHSPIFTNEGDYNRIVDWITINNGTERGVIKPRETATIEFTINVPESAAAGGQYACITVGSDSEAQSANSENDSAAISESLAIGHTVFAEITGTSEQSGEIMDMVIPSFLIGGKVQAASLVKNTGNVHSVAKYSFKVKSVFSDEILYDSTKVTLEGDDTHVIFPDRTYKEEEFWQDTPMMGIFDVQYKVEFMGSESEVSQMVIVCPWWLLTLFGIGLILMILRIITLMKLSGKKSKKLKNSLDID